MQAENALGELISQVGVEGSDANGKVGMRVRVRDSYKLVCNQNGMFYFRIYR